MIRLSGKSFMNEILCFTSLSRAQILAEYVLQTGRCNHARQAGYCRIDRMHNQETARIKSHSKYHPVATTHIIKIYSSAVLRGNARPQP